MAAITRELWPDRNVVIQIGNEFSQCVFDHVKTERSIDPKRIVTNSPGVAGGLGDPSQNNAFEYLTPHTSRQSVGRTWEVAPAEIEFLHVRYKKPVVDDEPARNGTPNFGGPKAATPPYDHIIPIQKMWQLGASILYHYDMFQTGYGPPACPPHGIPIRNSSLPSASIRGHCPPGALYATGDAPEKIRRPAGQRANVRPQRIQPQRRSVAGRFRYSSR